MPMIFLLEKVSNELEEKLKNWRNLSASEKGKVIKEFCTTANENGHDLSSISKYIQRNFDYNGADEENDFRTLMEILPFEPTANMGPNFYRLTQFQNANKVDFEDAEHLQSESLYTRPQKDFDYTLNLFEIVSHPDELKKFFKDTTEISVGSLYDGNGEIKDVGSDTDDSDITLKGTVNNWYKTHQAPEETKKKSKKHDNKYSIQDAMRNFNVPSEKRMQVLVYWIQQYADKLGYSDDQVQRATKILNSITSKRYDVLTDSQRKNAIALEKEDLKATKGYEEGTVGVIGNNRTPRGDFYIFLNGVWQPYEDVRGEYTSKDYDYIFNTKVLENETDKEQVARGGIDLALGLREYQRKYNDLSSY